MQNTNSVASSGPYLTIKHGSKDILASGIYTNSLQVVSSLGTNSFALSSDRV